MYINTSHELSINEYDKIRAKYPDKVPVIVVCAGTLNSIIKKKKFLVPYDITASYLLSIIRNKTNLNSNEALFMFINNKMISGHQIIGDLYREYLENLDFKFKDTGDRFFYIKISKENTFG